MHEASLPARLGKELRSAFGKPDTGIGDDQPHAGETAFLEVLEEGAPARSIAIAVHPDRNQQRNVAHLAGPAALEHDAVDAFNVSSTLPRTTRSRWLLIRSSSIVMTLFSGLGVSSPMAAPFRWPGCV